MKKTKKKREVRQSKTENFLENIQKDNSMIEYITNLRIMNPAATLSNQLADPKREGRFVRLAHARDEFEAPVITKGKSALRRKRSSEKSKK